MDTSNFTTAATMTDDDSPAMAGTRPFLVFADESGIDGQVYYGFGSLWLPSDRRGDLQQIVEALRFRHNYQYEIKWTKVSPKALPFYRALVEEFFRRKWLMFHALVVRKGTVDMTFHRDHDEARRKHFAMLIANKIRRFAGKGSEKRYRLRVDPIASRYAKADEAALKIINNSLKLLIGHPALESLVARDSKTTLGIQIADLLLGAVTSSWNDVTDAAAKLQLREWIAHHLGWPDLRADTRPTEAKFNVWYFYPQDGTPREAETRPVKLLYPLGTLIRT